jgi:hypothetical protein
MFAELKNTLITGHLNAGHTVSFNINTCSMTPAILPGDKLVIRKVTNKLPELGSIVVLQTNGHWVVHRLIYWMDTPSGKYFVTKGDNLCYTDAPWELLALWGVVIKQNRDGLTIDLSTTKVHLVGYLIAFLTRSQIYLSNISFNFLPRLLRFAVSRLLRIIVLAVYS